MKKYSAIETYQRSENSDKHKYCNDWIERNEGVSANSMDAPPSLYEPSVALSDSLMNITSISQNACPNDPKKGNKKNSATASLNKYENTSFM